VYVPAYNSADVYGPAPASYPYPAVSYPSTGELLAAGALSFGLGVAVGSIFNGGYYGWGWGSNWGPHGNVFVNRNFFVRNNNAFVNRAHWDNAYRGAGRTAWNHNPYYRGAVPYTNRAVANRYNAGRPVGARGLSDINRPGQQPIRPPMSTGNIRPGAGQGAAIRPGGGQGSAGRIPGNAGITRPGQGSAGVRAPEARGSASRVAGPKEWGNFGGSRPGGGSAGVNRGAFAGGNAGQARAASQRGFSSMGGGARGGGARGGFGGGGRGGGGRRGGGRR
jgi:hypothetical protein